MGVVSAYRRYGREKSSRRRKLVSGMNSSSSPERTLPLELRLRAIGDGISATHIDELWIFPPLPNRDVSCEFLVIICYDGQERRRILTAHVDAEPLDPDSDEVEWIQRVKEHGVVPQPWVSEMPDRMLKRLAEAGVPEVVEVGGSSDAWEEAIARFANGNGDGNGAADGLIPGVEQVDSGRKPLVVFDTALASVAPEGAE